MIDFIAVDYILWHANYNQILDLSQAIVVSLPLMIMIISAYIHNIAVQSL